MNKEIENQNKSELVLALERLERERNIKKEDVFKTIEEAIVSALRKHVGKTSQIVARMDPETGRIKAFLQMKVAETVVNPETEITLQKAKETKPKAEIGQDIEIPIEVGDFSRIAAQTAKQVLVQKIREIERDNLYKEFKPKEGEIVTGMVQRFLERDLIVDLGKAESMLPYSEQIKREHYSSNSRVKAVILSVEKNQRGPQILLSRASPLFLRRLFETEIPEIVEKIVEIVDIVREPGFRAKVVVRSNDLKVDPVGACVGIRGSRIKAIMDEISGERVDLITYSTNSVQMLTNSLSPARVSSVNVIDKELKRAIIIVPDDQLPIAIGKDGQNIRLACRLTGWNLEVKSEGQKAGEEKKAQAATSDILTQIEGIGPKLAELLIKAGMADIAKLATLKPEDLSTLQGVGLKTAAKIIQGAKKHVEKKTAGEPAEAAPEKKEEKPPVEKAEPAAEESAPPAGEKEEKAKSE